MSSYSINLVDNGDTTFTPTLLRSPTTSASGGTTITPPVQENTDGAYGNAKTKHVDDAIFRCLRAIMNDRAAGN